MKWKMFNSNKQVKITIICVKKRTGGLTVVAGWFNQKIKYTLFVLSVVFGVK
jgi:hypothetical protein